jgi:hypothetical protein
MQPRLREAVQRGRGVGVNFRWSSIGLDSAGGAGMVFYVIAYTVPGRKWISRRTGEDGALVPLKVHIVCPKYMRPDVVWCCKK